MNPAQLLFWWLATLSLLCRQASAAPLENEVRDMTYIGYEAHVASPRVFVRTNEPVRYSVERGRNNTITLVLDNTGISRSLNTRVLATQFLAGPVQSVLANVVENPSASVRVDISLKAPASFRVVQHDTELALIFY